MALLVGVLMFAGGAPRSNVPLLPATPPQQRAPQLGLERVIRLNVEVDDSFVEQYGERVEEIVREIIAIHNVEWSRYRRDWFELAELTLRPSGDERDASYLLARFLHRTAEAADTIHVNIVGRQLEVYTNGTSAMAIGGLAYRGSDAVLLSAAPGAPAELLAYYLFHELGHCWDAFDIPFHGGESTYGSKTRMTFHVDAGNEEIIEDAAGPLPRSTPGRAPMVLRERFARARAIARDTPVYGRLHDLLQHEPSPANPAYMRKKRALLAAAGKEREKVLSVLRPYELTRHHLRDDAEVRQQIAEHYWRANDAIRNHDYRTADAELQAIRVIAAATPDVHMLVGAVEKKIRRRR